MCVRMYIIIVYIFVNNMYRAPSVYYNMFIKSNNSNNNNSNNNNNNNNNNKLHSQPCRYYSSLIRNTKQFSPNISG